MDVNESRDKQNKESEEYKSRLERAEKERDELKELLSETSKKLADSESFKSHFIARISNEIINPFTAIITIAENLLKKEKMNEREDMTDMVELIHSEALFLDFQLRNLFTAARIEAGELVPETVRSHLYPIVSESIKGFEEEAAKKGIHFLTDIKISNTDQLITDPSLLALVMKNLLSNAIKFSENEAVVCIKSSFEKGVFVFSVTNKGMQIPSEKLEVIFDRFRQLDTKIHSLNPGSGIGLSVAREVLELLNGTIEAQPTNEGMKFRIKVSELQYSNGIAQDDESIFFDEEESGGESF